MITIERWKTVIINNEPTHFEISTEGRLKNLKTQHWKHKGIVKPRLNKKNGYCQYCLCTDGVSQYHYAHRLVAQAFIPNPSNKPQVNHKDGNKQNNTLSNLEWVTQEENMKHCFEYELSSAAKRCYVYDLKGDFVGEWISISEACRQLNISGYGEVISQERYHAFGYQFRVEGDDTPVLNIEETCKYQKCEVVQLTMDNKFVKHYKTITQAYTELGVTDNGIISQVCKGRRKSYKGYKWVYARHYYK